MGIFRVLRNDMTLIYLNNTIQNVILNIVLIKKNNRQLMSVTVIESYSLIDI